MDSTKSNKKQIYFYCGPANLEQPGSYAEL